MLYMLYRFSQEILTVVVARVEKILQPISILQTKFLFSHKLPCSTIRSNSPQYAQWNERSIALYKSVLTYKHPIRGIAITLNHHRVYRWFEFSFVSVYSFFLSSRVSPFRASRMILLAPRFCKLSILGLLRRDPRVLYIYKHLDVPTSNRAGSLFFSANAFGRAFGRRRAPSHVSQLGSRLSSSLSPLCPPLSLSCSFPSLLLLPRFLRLASREFLSRVRAGSLSRFRPGILRRRLSAAPAKLNDRVFRALGNYDIHFR